jgi:hypothetical protein
MSCCSMLSRHMLASTGAEAGIIGLAIMAMIDFSLWSAAVLRCLTARCRALHIPRVSAEQLDRYHQVLYVACPRGWLRYPDLCRMVRAKEVCIDIMLTISIPGGLRAWPSLQRVARQYFGGRRKKLERYHTMI